MITINDIQIFIITHNRADLIGESIESLLSQTAGVKEITVLDNESTDNTEEVVKSFASRGVKYIKTQGFLANHYKAKEIANKEYVMLFHDDDILHPDYLKNALKILNKEKNLTALYTRYTTFKNNDSPKNFSKLKKDYHLFKKQKDFAIFMFFKEIIAYATAIYKTDLFKKIDLEYDKFSKFNDWPFMLKFAKYGKVALFDDERAFSVRLHEGQDTRTYTNSPSFEQIINWDKFFYEIFFEKEDINLRQFYNQKSTYFMKGKYNAFIPLENKKDFTIDNLYQLAREKGLKIQDYDFSKITDSYKKFSNLLKYKYIKNNICKRIKYFNLRIKNRL